MTQIMDKCLPVHPCLHILLQSKILNLRDFATESIFVKYKRIIGFGKNL